MNQRDIFLRYTAQTSPNPMGIEVDKAEGIYLYGPNGEKYMDLISGISVANVGHRHPKVVQAIKDQVDQYLHVMVYGEYIQSPVNNLALKLLAILPENLDSVYFVNSGTEANEAAIKLAKRHTGRTEIISFNKSYHGNTQGSLSVSGNELKKAAFRPLIPGSRILDFNDIDQLRAINDNTAAVIVEPVQGDAGVIIPDKKFLWALRSQCDKTGSLLIFDEVQTGFGRTGKFFAFEHFEVVPDVLTMAKGMGGGMPIGAFVANYATMQKLTNNPMLGHITTFGGNPVCCAAAEAVIGILTEGKLLFEVENKGVLIEKLLLENSGVKAIRRIGLMIAVEFENEDIVQQIVKKCLDKGIIIYFFLSTRNSFRLAPPLIITEQEIRKSCQIIGEVIKEVIEG